MKRIFTVLLAAALLLGLSLPMTSCGDETARLESMNDEKRSQRLFKQAEEALTEAEEATIRRHLLVKNPNYSSSCTVTEHISYVNADDTYGYLNNTHTVLRLGGDGVISTTEVGYKDGYAFAYRKEGVGESRFKAPMDAETFKTANVTSSEPPSIGLRIGEDTCKTVTTEHLDNGNWKVICEGFTETKAAAFLDRQHAMATDLTETHKPLDLLVTLVMSPELVPTTVTVEVIFHDSKEYRNAKPTVTVSYDLMLGESSGAAGNLVKIKTDQYAELSDLSILNAFFDGLAARESAGKGEFAVDTTSTAKSSGETQTATITQSVTYGNAGGYRFTLVYEEPSGKSYELAYAGTHLLQTTYGKMGNKIETKSTRMLDAQAKLTVSECMNPHGITTADIETAQLISAAKGTYRYTLREASTKRLASTLLKGVFSGSQVEITDYSCVLDVYMPNGILENYTITVYADATVDEIPLTLATSVSVIFYDFD